MAQPRNILFVMCDQLRWDYLSCTGHPTLRTPVIDELARRGVRFDKAYVQSASCGPSRMSYYTGRYVSSHRAFGNFVPLPLDEHTLGDVLRPLGVRVALDGKSHAEADPAALRARGIAPDSMAGVLASEAGFEPFDRHDGVLVDGAVAEIESNRYTGFLRARGYGGHNPWLTHANSAQAADGSLLSGWRMRHAHEPARVQADHSETAYTTSRAIEFMREQGDAPWCLHLSYIKPHWPYVAPAPYHALYGSDDVVPAKCHPAERDTRHLVLRAYQAHPASQAFASDEVRRRVIPTYMGLVRQIDDELGRLMAFMADAGRLDDTLIVFCSDHGDYLGDHYLGEKELWHDSVIRIPLIVVDPSSEADATRGTVDSTHFVEAIDLLPTFVEALGGVPDDTRVEGRSLLPLLRGAPRVAWREFIVNEFDLSFRTGTRRELGRPIKQGGMAVIRDDRWKYVQWQGFAPLLFDLQADPDEYHDLAGDPAYAGVIGAYDAKWRVWLQNRKRYTTTSDAFVDTWLDDPRFGGMAIGVW